MKILDFIPYYRPHIGGLEKFGEELHKELITHGDEFIVFTPRLPESAPIFEEIPGLKIIRYPAFEIISNYPMPKFWTKEYRNLYKRLATEKADVVISTSRFFFQAIIAHFFCKKHSKPRVHIEHGSGHVTSTPLISFLAYLYDHTLGQIALRGANQVVVPSISAARFVHTLTGKTPPVIYRGLPFRLDTPVEKNLALREQYIDKKIITYLGRLIYGKGVAVLLKAIQKIERDDFVLLIVGDGPEMENLVIQTKKLHLTSKVHFVGSKPFLEAMGILKASDIFVNPSFNEGLPTSVLEAAACQTTIIATDAGGTNEIVEHEKSAIIIPINDSHALQLALERLLGDGALRKHLSDTAYQVIQKRFDWQKNAFAYHTLFNNLL